ncbi:two-component system response regulator CreB [Methylobacter marinus]|uniref:two-component system response regulator CreB n=1 Tax=Methylobacter marinus TaxID=34058 RepID=UPI00038180CC|nr:two-component system response regulator CreB [Methylobacter marinus]
MSAVLIIENEPAIAETICYALNTDGFKTHWSATGADGLEQALALRPQLIILDIGLPDMNGFDVLRSLQARLAAPPPVIFLTARTEEIDRVVGLELGADDYIGKPFSPRELNARVRAVLRRSQPKPEAPQPIAAPERFRIFPEQYEIRYYGLPLDLTLQEYRLLHTFISQPQRVFTREELLAQCWDAPEHRLDRAIDTHIKTLRAKLHAVRPQEDAIRTLRGIGYALNPPA